MISVLQKDMTKCYLCQTTFGLQLHHVYEGSKRKKADREHCVVKVCAMHHSYIHNTERFNRYLKEECQLAWMEANDASERDFIKVFGKSYL